MNGASIVWFRQDLRLHDNPALVAACQRGEPVIPIYMWCPEEEGRWSPGAASRWWLHQSLQNLRAQLRSAGSNLALIKSFDTFETIMALAKTTAAEVLYFNRRHEPAVAQRDRRLVQKLESAGMRVVQLESSSLIPCRNVLENKVPRVYSAFWRRYLENSEVELPLGAPRIPAPPAVATFDNNLDTFNLLPAVDWAHGIRQTWQTGELEALSKLKDFLNSTLAIYSEHRDVPGTNGTSTLSPHLHFGEISPKVIWHAVETAVAANGVPRESANKFKQELGWREFAIYTLEANPNFCEESLKPEFENIPLNEDTNAISKWQKGQTGYPIVDAGMRELWHTGWMHNRVRMIVASFLTKHLLQRWQIGASWFWDTLVDADLPNNSLGWQWAAGSGVDPMPYFRIFNPTLQGKKFDKNGDYITKWVPELQKMPAAFLHEPERAPKEVLTAAGIMAEEYPAPMVNHKDARRRALARFAETRS